ncbi:MAG: hypothetical protein Q4A82_05800 [Corynebacterium sp.]|nr:hypothetical protein [Corynebacterium sp.]
MIMAQSEKQIARNGMPTAMPFKVKDPYEPQDWSDRIRDYHVVFNFWIMWNLVRGGWCRVNIA